MEELYKEWKIKQKLPHAQLENSSGCLQSYKLTQTQSFNVFVEAFVR